jgi:hypothetical protein
MTFTGIAAIEAPHLYAGVVVERDKIMKGAAHPRPSRQTSRRYASMLDHKRLKLGIYDQHQNSGKKEIAHADACVAGSDSPSSTLSGRGANLYPRPGTVRMNRGDFGSILRRSRAMSMSTL